MLPDGGRSGRAVLGVVALAVLTAITLGLSQLERAAPSVERASVWLDKVERGQMLRQVRGTGTLVPEVIRWIPAASAGRVERVLVLPGATVEADSVLVELSNPQLELDAANAEWGVKSAEAQLESLGVTLRNDLLALQASVARTEAGYSEAQLQAEVDQELFDSGLISERSLKLSLGRVKMLAKLNEIEQQRLETWNESQEARLAAQRAAVEQAKALYRLRRAQVTELKVQAGTTGVLEQLLVEVGHQVTPGTPLAKVTDVRSLKAVVRIPETQARDVQPGLLAEIDTRNVVIPGRVVRIDPAVHEGTVAVDVHLEGELPRGARPDLTVVGNDRAGALGRRGVRGSAGAGASSEYGRSLQVAAGRADGRACPGEVRAQLGEYYGDPGRAAGRGRSHHLGHDALG